MSSYLIAAPVDNSLPITLLSADQLNAWLRGKPAGLKAWVTGSGFQAAPGTFCLLPGKGGAPARVLAGIDPEPEIWSFAGLPAALPAGTYHLDPAPRPALAEQAALGWLLGTYEFTRYKKSDRRFATLVCPKGADRAAAQRLAEGIFLVRDLVNTPAGDMGPAALAEAATALAKKHKAKIAVIAGDALLEKNYPTIHAVGRAADDAPRLIDLRWGGRGPRITLVGKGVTFDSGGLDLKSAAGMKLMKKDMGGGAHVLGLASVIMAAKLPVRLRVLVPAVENAVSGNAFRPLDVIRTRKGLTVEVGNTDAEGRLVLSDALAEAASETPDLIVDFATLTGAARVALGTELPAMFCNRERTAAGLLRHSVKSGDPVWRLPLHRPYRRSLESKVADLNNISNGPFGGAITAALFLQEFLPPEIPWIHLDIMAWNLAGRPGRPEGGEAMGLRAVYGLIAELAAVKPRKSAAGG